MFLHFRPRRCAHPKPPRTADDSFPDSAIIRLLIPASPDHTKRCPATTLPPPNALALRSALPSLPASLLLKALSASAKPPSPASLPNASMPAASTTARTIPSSPISTKPSPAPLFALRCTSSLSARSASAKPSPLKLPARSSPISSWKRTAFSPTSISTTPSSSSTSATTKLSPRTFPLPTWSSISRPSPKSSAPASPKKLPATSPTSPPNTSRKSPAPTNISSSATPPPTSSSSTPPTSTSSSAATTSSSSSSASRNPSEAPNTSSPSAPPTSFLSPSFRTEQADFFFPLRSCEAVGLRREKSLFLFARRQVSTGSRDWDRGDHLLLVVLRVRAVVVGADKRRVISRSGRGVAEVVANKSVVIIRRVARVRPIQLPVLEVDADGPVRRSRQVRLELIDVQLGVVVNLNRRGPTLAVVKGGAQDDVVEAGAEVLPSGVERVMACHELPADPESDCDAVPEGGVGVAGSREGWELDRA